MKKVAIFFGLGIVVLNLVSCSIKENIPVNDPGTTSFSTDFFNPVHEERIVNGDIGKYREFYSPSDYSAIVSVSKPSPIDCERSCCMVRNNSILPTKTVSGIRPVISADGIVLEPSSPSSVIAPVFGKTVEFSLKSGRTKSGSASQENIQMYIPERIEITSPVVTTEENMFPLCWYNDLVIRWNGDSFNENGVIFVIEWSGSMVFGESNQNALIRRILRVPDNGETVLSSSVFDGIPDTALCQLTVLRGNIENTLVDGESYKVSGITSAAMQFVLIRNMIRK